MSKSLPPPLKPTIGASLDLAVENHVSVRPRTEAPRNAADHPAAGFTGYVSSWRPSPCGDERGSAKEECFVIEMIPVPMAYGASRGVVAEGSVGSHCFRALPDLPLQGAPLARGSDPRRRRSGREPAATERQLRSRPRVLALVSSSRRVSQGVFPANRGRYQVLRDVLATARRTRTRASTATQASGLAIIGLRSSSATSGNATAR